MVTNSGPSARLVTADTATAVRDETPRGVRSSAPRLRAQPRGAREERLSAAIRTSARVRQRIARLITGW